MQRILALVIVVLFLYVPATFASEIEFQESLNSFFGFMPAEFDFEHARQAEGYWDRPFFELFEWGMIEPEEGYSVWVPGLPGCWSEGRTEKESLENIKDAIQAYLETTEELSKGKQSRYVEVG